jgi:hypothetical protein
MFVNMTTRNTYNTTLCSGIPLVLDMSDCYTWSFPEFLPFCSRLYYFSSYKEFDSAALA